MAARGSGLGLMNYLRVEVHASALNHQSPLRTPPNSFLRRCRFSEEIRRTFLDKSEVTDRVISCVKKFDNVDPSKVTPTAHFYDDLGLDSLDAIEICMDLDTEFGFEIPENEVDKIVSVNQAVDFIASHPQAK